VSTDGYILTKASELTGLQAVDEKEEEPGAISVRIGEGVLYEHIEIEGVDVASDIALLKVEAEGLKPINFTSTENLKQGTWVVVNGATSRERRRHRVGIISAKARELTKTVRVVVGIGLKTEDEELHITSVSEESGAEEAGFKEGDIIQTADGTKLSTRKELMELLREKKPGDKMMFKYSREGEQKEVEVELMAKPSSKKQKPLTRNDSMSGRFSKRRDGFGQIIQIDVPISERGCGGPLLDLDGNCLGLVIAYANRAEKFVIPSEDVQVIYEELKASEE